MMETHESTLPGHKSSNKDPVKEKTPLQRKWASEPSATTRQSPSCDPGPKQRETTSGSTPQQKYAFAGNTRTLLSGPSAVGAIGRGSQDPQGSFVQEFPIGYSYQRGQPYPQHPQTERFLSGAKPQPGLEPHAWPFAGQLPSDDLYPVGLPGHTHPHGAGARRFPRQKSPSLPSSFGHYSQSGPEPAEEGHSRKEAKPKKLGKYICHYCGRACAKPSVLKKHIRSHTGERPFPCAPCGFSFKTKSNLYKHRKSHAHAIKAGLVPFSELAVARCGDMDQACPAAEVGIHSDGDQSTDTDEEGTEGSTMLTDNVSPLSQISFETEKNTGGVEPAYADLAEELPVGSMKVPILIIPKPGGVPSTGMECPPFQDMKGSHRLLASQTGGRAHSLDDPPTVKQRLALRLNDKKSQDSDSTMTQSLNLLSPHSKGSTDSGYFSRSESAEQPVSPPNTNVKTYEEIMFGRTWYYRPNSRCRQSVTVAIAGADPCGLPVLKKPGAIVDTEKLTEGCFFLRGEVDPKQYPTGPCQSSTGLLEPPLDSGPLIRSNSMPTSSPSHLSLPPGIRGSHSFDEMITSDDVFYPPRRLRRQAAFEHSANEAHGGEAEGCAHKNVASSLCLKMGERISGVPEHIAYSPYGTKVSMSEIATRKRRKEKSVGDEEDCPGNGDSSRTGSVELTGDYEFKQGSLDGSRGTPKGKGYLPSAPSQSDSSDTCASMYSEDIALFLDSDSRKAAGNVISVIQHTNSLSQPSSFEKSESLEQPGYQPSGKVPSGQYSEQSDTEIFEDALSSESVLLRTESMEQQQSDSDPTSFSSSTATASPGQPYHIPHKLVRQPNIQVPEIRVTEEPDKPEKDADAPAQKQSEKQQQHVEEFQLPQRSDTLSKMPSEKLPPKKKRLRLTDMEHSSGESSFESACTSLSRSPSQDSNLSHSSSLSMSFDRDEGLKPVSPTKQDESLVSCGGLKQSEFLTVPGSGHSSHHQQREMRRSSSEQAPCTLPTELAETRSKSFDYGSLSTSQQGEANSSSCSMKERRRGHLVRQASLRVYPEAVPQEPGAADMTIKQENLEHGEWPGPAGSPHSNGDQVCRTKRVGACIGGVTSHQQRLLQQSISEDSLQDEPLCSRFQQHGLQAQGSSEGEHPGQEVMNQEVIQLAQEQVQQLQLRPAGHMIHKQQPPHPGTPERNRSSYFSSSLAQQQSIQHCPPCSTGGPLLLQQVQPVFATQTLSPQALVPEMRVPVRVQTHVPSFGSIMYTSVSQLIAAPGSEAQGEASARPGARSLPLTGGGGPGLSPSHLQGHTDGPPGERWPSAGVPLSLTSGTVSTTDASGPIMGGGKRLLSPAGSLELLMQTKQQKRVKEERLYGQMLRGMSAVELSGPEASRGPRPCRTSGDSVEDWGRVAPSPLNHLPVATKILVPVRSSAPHHPDVPRAESFTPPLQIVTESSPGPEGPGSPEQIHVDYPVPESRSSPQSMVSSSNAEDPGSRQQILIRGPVPLAAHQSRGGSGALVLTGVTDLLQVFQFPSLRTTSRVSWCFLNDTQPSSSPAAPRGSVYSSWCVRSHNPNPLDLSTRAALALLRSRQTRSPNLLYTAAAAPAGSGKLVSSVAWRQRSDQLHPEVAPPEAGRRKTKGVVLQNYPKEEQIEKEAKQPPTEPSRIRIFEGGYKSSEDYVYVRGRGRGKYICEECGIRCKKPSMLKKHIRTHTDVRPYACKLCSFAFKTKGNLTKHMKSKAHMKKCLELGVPAEEEEEEGAGDEGQRSQRTSWTAEHQFSDADDSEEDGDDVDDEDDDEEDDGDSTPKTRSRSTSPTPYSPASISAAGSSFQPAPRPGRPPLLGYFPTVPSIQITPQPPPRPPAGTEHGPPEIQQGATFSRLLAPPCCSMDEDLLSPPPGLSSPSPDYSCCPSPGSPSSSPSARRYLSPHAGQLSPRRDASPLRHISPKRDLGVAGGYRDLSPRRGQFSLLSPLSRPTSPAGRDYKRDLSPRGRHRGVIRPASPRRGLHQHLPLQSQHSGSWRLRGHQTGHQTGLQTGLSAQAGLEAPGHHRGSTDMETDHCPGSLSLGWDQTDSHSNQSSPPHQVLFSHLPLHSQLQVHSLFPMIPIRGIHLVHSVPMSVKTPLAQQEDSNSSETTSPNFTSVTQRGVRHEEEPPHPSSQEREGARSEQEEIIHTCTKAIASLCIASEELIERAGGGRGGAGEGASSSCSSPSALDSQQWQHFSTSLPSPQPPLSPSQGPEIQHFSGCSSLSPPPSPLLPLPSSLSSPP